VVEASSDATRKAKVMVKSQECDPNRPRFGRLLYMCRSNRSQTKLNRKQRLSHVKKTCLFCEIERDALITGEVNMIGSKRVKWNNKEKYRGISEGLSDILYKMLIIRPRS
jgi:hypothetical protein